MRARQVTRTIITRKVDFKAFNMETATVENMSISFGVNVTINKDAEGINTINKKLQADGIKATAVMIDTITDNETLYGMLEDDFIRLAKVLPPRTANNEEQYLKRKLNIEWTAGQGVKRVGATPTPCTTYIVGTIKREREERNNGKKTTVFRPIR